MFIEPRPVSDDPEENRRRHKEAYPEQYSHQRCGEEVLVYNDRRQCIGHGIVERVFRTQYGLLCKLHNQVDYVADFFALNKCEKVKYRTLKRRS